MNTAAANKARIPFQEGSKYPPANANITAAAPKKPLTAAPLKIAKIGEVIENAETRTDKNNGRRGFTLSKKGKN